MRYPGFIGGAYHLRSVALEAQRCVNLYPEAQEMGTSKVGEIAALVGTPGLRLLQAIGDGPIRGMIRRPDNTGLIVSGPGIYKVSDWDSAATLIGSLDTSTGPVSMADSGVEVCVVDGTYGYIYTSRTGGWAKITSENWKPSDTVVFIDGYFLFNESGAGKFFFSGLYDGATIDALDFVTAEAKPDNIIAIAALNRYLWAFGSQSIQVFANTGDSTSPWAAVSGALIEHGVASPHSVQLLDNTLFWLSDSMNGHATVWRAVGYQPQRVSTHAIEFALQQYGDLSQARAWCYQEDGHQFYCLTVPGTDSTWVYDVATGLWHERAYFASSSEQGRHRADCHAMILNEHAVGDYENGNVYALDPSVYTDNGNTIVRLRSATHVLNGMKRNFYNSFELIMIMGGGLDGSVQGSNPQVMMQYSDDGGFTWGNEMWRTCSRLGGYKRRAWWQRLGYARDRVFRVKIADPISVILCSAELELKTSAS